MGRRLTSWLASTAQLGLVPKTTPPRSLSLQPARLDPSAQIPRLRDTFLSIKHSFSAPLKTMRQPRSRPGEKIDHHQKRRLTTSGLSSSTSRRRNQFPKLTKLPPNPPPRVPKTSPSPKTCTLYQRPHTLASRRHDLSFEATTMLPRNAYRLTLLFPSFSSSLVSLEDDPGCVEERLFLELELDFESPFSLFPLPPLEDGSVLVLAFAEDAVLVSSAALRFFPSNPRKCVPSLEGEMRRGEGY